MLPWRRLTRRRFKPACASISGKKADVATAEEAQHIVADLQAVRYTVAEVKKTTRRRNPAPPFTTSTLQQEAVRKLRFSTQRTMRVAQQLYEGLALGDEGEVGLITYMRTDSTRLADEAVQEARQYIHEHYGKDYIPTQPRRYRSQKAAQEAHEAIRPTSVLHTPDQVKRYLSAEQQSLYTLIWNRLVASQMSSAVLDHTTVDVTARQYSFRATGAVMRFPGFTALYEESLAETVKPDTDAGAQNRLLPPLAVGQDVQVTSLEPNQHFTQPPPRFTEASLVSELEKLGIGRPSTYASILGTLRERRYVEDQDRRFIPTELGTTVNGLLVESFPDLLNVQFTAQLEDKLDQIEEGKREWVETLHAFYKPFMAELQQATHKMRDVRKEVEETDEVCEKCQRPMVIRRGRFGRFMACSGYPGCKNTRELSTETPAQAPAAPSVAIACEQCGRPMALKRSRYGEFLACTGYPACKATQVQWSLASWTVRCHRAVAHRTTPAHDEGKRSTAVRTIPAVRFRSGSVRCRKPVHSVRRRICWRNRRRNRVSPGSARRVNTRKQCCTAAPVHTNGHAGTTDALAPMGAVMRSSWMLLDDEHAPFCRHWRWPGRDRSRISDCLRTVYRCSSTKCVRNARLLAHQTDLLGELVCSNSLKADTLTSGARLLKAELRQLGSLILQRGRCQSRASRGGAGR